MKPLVFDCFTYSNEEALLRLRLETLHEVVDRFVIAEGSRTFTGKPKTPGFRPERFEKFRDKISYIVVDDLDASPADPWVNEYHQRNALARGLADAAPHDWVMLSDVDEIIAPQAVGQFEPARYRCAALHQRMYYYFLNNELMREGRKASADWTFPRMTTVAQLRDFYGTLQNLRIYRPPGLLRGARRYLHKRTVQHIGNAGWHFSWLMTAEQIVEKIEAFSHAEYNTAQFKDIAAVRTAMAEGRDLFGRDMAFCVKPLDETFPAYVRAHMHDYAQWIAAVPALGAKQ
jgi:beta-1,4-mannosyl-glycoprotein beta-1,4-N-acetylglucosaminyltransferase